MMAVILTPVTGWAQPGGSLFEQHCAPCHGSPEPGSRAPDREALRQFTPERVLELLTTGAMAVEVPGANPVSYTHLTLPTIYSV